MRDRSRLFMAALMCGTVWIAGAAVWAAGGPEVGRSTDVNRYGIGRPASPQEIANWNIDVAPTGEGLPTGRGTVKHGAQVYARSCAGCHGRSGGEGPAPPLVGGRNTLRTAHPMKTIGSYWPYATTLYDYVYRAMPFSAPQSLTPDEVYSVVAWLLYQNGIIDESTVMDPRSLPAVRMPNRDGFIPDPRPEGPVQ
jgi:S-disulfanyl-L-cysteine oxidoreductase SoxD